MLSVKIKNVAFFLQIFYVLLIPSTHQYVLSETASRVESPVLGIWGATAAQN